MSNIILVSKRIYNDPEINGRIYAQLCELNVSQILDQASIQPFFEHTFSAMHKLHAALYHLNNYCRIEIEQEQEMIQLFKVTPNERREAFELIFELEAFLFQIKSSLDMLVKLMIPILHPHKVATHTFESKGRELIKGLQKYKHRNDANAEAADLLISLVEHDMPWIEEVVGMRDELSHVRALKNYQFEPANQSSELTVRKPSFKGRDTIQFMATVASNNLQFQQDFMSVALTFKAPKAFKLIPLAEDSTHRKDLGDVGKFLKWTWGVDLSNAKDPA